MASGSRIFALNRQIFNTSLYHSIHSFWFAGLPPGATTPTGDLTKRWFMPDSPADKEAFDAQCAAKYKPALDAIGPSQYPISAKLDGTLNTERRAAYDIARPFLPDLARPDIEEATVVALSLLILLDQLPRNIYRKDQGLIYGHYDVLARAVLRCMLGTSKDGKDGKDGEGGSGSGSDNRGSDVSSGSGAIPDTEGGSDYRPPDIPRFDLRVRLRGVPALRTFMMMPLMHSEYMDDHFTFERMAGDMRSAAEAKGDKAAVDNVDQLLGFEKKHKEILERFGRYPYRNEACERQTTNEEKNWLDEGGETFTA